MRGSIPPLSPRGLTTGSVKNTSIFIVLWIPWSSHGVTN
ncbi:proline/betaine transporter [Rickettsia endosymbiont of Ixodes scapularis]|nr:proline/betaine transporter [Rickettsia endosymbiont of Ixodes scapularis]